MFGIPEFFDEHPVLTAEQYLYAKLLSTGISDYNYKYNINDSVVLML
jgi:hypothetical protein